jgi:hypothetical protein
VPDLQPESEHDFDGGESAVHPRLGGGEEVEASGPRPRARYRHALVAPPPELLLHYRSSQPSELLPLIGVAVLLGGESYDPSTYYSDVWLWGTVNGSRTWADSLLGKSRETMLSHALGVGATPTQSFPFPFPGISRHRLGELAPVPLYE